MKPSGIFLTILFLSGAVKCTTVTVNTEMEMDNTEAETTAFSIPQTTNGPTLTYVCDPSLVALSNQTGAPHRRCKCSDKDVDCSYLNTTELPKFISFPVSAEVVTFVGNQIKSIERDIFHNGPFVLELDLSHNYIDFIGTKVFRSFKTLMTLNLSHNKIWKLLPKSFDGLNDLRYLDLGYNDIVAISPELFIYIPNLSNLNLDSNPLEELEPKQFEHLKKLEYLYLESTLLMEIPNQVFELSPNIKVLKLSDNRLIEVPTHALKVLESLEHLDLSGNPISQIKEGAFQGMWDLGLLYLNRMQKLTRIEKHAFGDLRKLQELHCSYNYYLSEIDEKAFVKKTTNQKVQLSQLFLKQNSLKTLPKELLDWNDNVELHVTDNPIYCDCNIDWMVHLNLKNEFQKHIKCIGPVHFQNLPVGDLKDKELTCESEVRGIQVIFAAGGIGFMMLALIIVFLMWKRNSQRVSKKNMEDIYW